MRSRWDRSTPRAGRGDATDDAADSSRSSRPASARRSLRRSAIAPTSSGCSRIGGFGRRVDDHRRGHRREDATVGEAIEAIRRQSDEDEASCTRLYSVDAARASARDRAIARLIVTSRRAWCTT